MNLTTLRKSFHRFNSSTLTGAKKDKSSEMTVCPFLYHYTQLISNQIHTGTVQTMPGGGYATIKIELPENWDSLMTELGYEPLESYVALVKVDTEG